MAGDDVLSEDVTSEDVTSSDAFPDEDWSKAREQRLNALAGAKIARLASSIPNFSPERQPLTFNSLPGLAVRYSHLYGALGFYSFLSGQSLFPGKKEIPGEGQFPEPEPGWPECFDETKPVNYHQIYFLGRNLSVAFARIHGSDLSGRLPLAGGFEIKTAFTNLYNFGCFSEGRLRFSNVSPESIAARLIEAKRLDAAVLQPAWEAILWLRGVYREDTARHIDFFGVPEDDQDPPYQKFFNEESTHSGYARHALLTLGIPGLDTLGQKLQCAD